MEGGSGMTPPDETHTTLVEVRPRRTESGRRRRQPWPTGPRGLPESTYSGPHTPSTRVPVGTDAPGVTWTGVRSPSVETLRGAPGRLPGALPRTTTGSDPVVSPSPDGGTQPSETGEGPGEGDREWVVGFGVSSLRVGQDGSHRSRGDTSRGTSTRVLAVTGPPLRTKSVVNPRRVTQTPDTTRRPLTVHLSAPFGDPHLWRRT